MSDTPALDELLAKPMNRNPYQGPRRRTRICFKYKVFSNGVSAQNVGRYNMTWNSGNLVVNGNRRRPNKFHTQQKVYIRTFRTFAAKRFCRFCDELHSHLSASVSICGDDFGDFSHNVEAAAYVELAEPARFLHLYSPKFVADIMACGHPKAEAYVMAMADLILKRKATTLKEMV